MTDSSLQKTSLLPLTIGRFRNTDGGFTTLPFSLVEQDRARRYALRVLNTFHFRTGSNILLTSTFDETLQFMPFERAVMTYGMVVVSADSTPWDGKRVESIARRFDLTAAAGISKNVVDGLNQLGFKIEELLPGIPVWAKQDAYDDLKALPGMQVYRYLEAGPLVGFECSQGNGVHIDRFEWNIDEIDGEIVASSRLPRCVEFNNFRTGLKARIDRSACNCGNTDPRIIPE